MRILCLSNLYPNPGQELRGIFVRSQVMDLTRLGCDVKVVAPVPLAPAPLRLFKNRWRIYGQIPENEVSEELEVFHPRYLLLPRNWLFEYSGWFYYHAIRKLVIKLEREWPFDLIHAHTALPDGYAAMVISGILGRPFIVTIHGRDLQDTVTRNRRCRAAVLKVLRSAGAVVNVSSKLADACRYYLGEDPRIKVLGNGIEPGEIYSGNSILREKYADCRIILSVGSLRKTKGHDLTLRSFKTVREKFKNARLLIIGGGGEKERLMKLAAELEISEWVEFITPLPRHKVMEYMSICDLFVLPSWSEGFGIVYLEAMAHGKPVIGVKGQGISDVIYSGENGLLVEPLDTAGLASNMISLLEDEAWAERLGTNAKRTVLNSFTWERNARHMLNIYHDLLKRRDCACLSGS